MDYQNQVAIEFKRRAGRGEKLLGAWFTLPHPVGAKMMARAGFDFVIVDTEHDCVNIESLAAILEQFATSKTLAMVRVAWNDMVMVKQALDAGARAIMFPMVNSPAEAQRAVSYCYYPPRGVRGFGPLRASDYFDGLADYMATIHEAITVWVQIEHIHAVRQAEAIASVEGVDALFIGPADLSASMGMLLQFDRPEIEQAIADVVAAGRKAGKLVGMAVDTTPEEALRRLESGIQAVTLGDMWTFFRSGAEHALEMIRETLAAREM